MLRLVVRKILAASATWHTHSLPWYSSAGYSSWYPMAMGLITRLLSRKVRSDKQRDSRRWLNTEAMVFWVSTKMLSRFPKIPIELVRTVATPEHQNSTAWKHIQFKMNYVAQY